MNIKNFIKQQTVSHADSVGGYVESIADDGLMTVILKGRASSKIKLYNNTSLTFSEGSPIEVGRLEGDNQKYSVIGLGTYSVSSSEEIITI